VGSRRKLSPRNITGRCKAVALARRLRLDPQRFKEQNLLHLVSNRLGLRHNPDANRIRSFGADGYRWDKKITLTPWSKRYLVVDVRPTGLSAVDQRNRGILLGLLVKDCEVTLQGSKVRFGAALIGDADREGQDVKFGDLILINRCCHRRVE